MTVELRPYGDKCNLRCQYCYENPLRDHNLPEDKPNWESIKTALKGHDKNFTIFGGDPLVIPLEELEEIWKFGMENWKTNGIQTNGTLITPQHIALFKQYNVSVGFSIDGPHMLNDARSAPSGVLSATRLLTEASNQNLRRCMKEGISTSLICTLTKMNASESRLPLLIEWFEGLGKLGLKHIRLHLLENDGVDHLQLTLAESAAAFRAFYDLQEKSEMIFDLFGEMEKKLRGKQEGCCVYQGCDPCNTPAVQGIGELGQPTNCGRSNKEGIDFLKSDEPTEMRDWILENTPQDENGCQDCEYWYACHGNCPGSGINGDWRNRTTHCNVLKILFQMILEEKDIELLESKKVCRAQKKSSHGDGHGDHTDNRPHGDHTDGIIRLPKLEVRSGS
jgi:uncharacterized protein